MASRSTATASAGSAALAAWRVASLLLLVAAYVPPHLLSKWTTGRSRWPRRFLAAAARLFGAEVRLVGAPLAPRSLLLANHTSWLDILALGGATGCAFVSKHEIERVPVVGWLANQNHTLYIDRSNRRESHRQVRKVADRIEAGRPLALFPEGTTGDGRVLLPFLSTLLGAVAPAPDGVEVRPIAIDYGAAIDEVAWVAGEPGLANVRRVLRRRGRIPVTIQLLDPLPPGEDRKAMARDARAAIVAALPSARAAEGL